MSGGGSGEQSNVIIVNVKGRHLRGGLRVIVNVDVEEDAAVTTTPPAATPTYAIVTTPPQQGEQEPIVYTSVQFDNGTPQTAVFTTTTPAA